MQEEKLLRLKKKVDQLKIDQEVKKEKRKTTLEDLKKYDLTSSEDAYERAKALGEKAGELEVKRDNLTTKVENKLEAYE